MSLIGMMAGNPSNTNLRRERKVEEWRGDDAKSLDFFDWTGVEKSMEMGML